METQIKVLFVCLGNICRSPLAEGIFNHKIHSRSRRISSDSCGTSDWHLGENPDPRSVHIAAVHGIPLIHQGRQIKASDFKEFDYILAMDKENLESLKQVQKQVADPRAQLILMRHFDPEAESMDVPDPYFGGEDGFQLIYDILDRSCDTLLESICKDHRLDG